MKKSQISTSHIDSLKITINGGARLEFLSSVSGPYVEIYYSEQYHSFSLNEYTLRVDNHFKANAVLLQATNNFLNKSDKSMFGLFSALLKDAVRAKDLIEADESVIVIRVYAKNQSFDVRSNNLSISIQNSSLKNLTITSNNLSIISSKSSLARLRINSSNLNGSISLDENNRYIELDCNNLSLKVKQKGFEGLISIDANNLKTNLSNKSGEIAKGLFLVKANNANIQDMLT